MRVFKCRRVSGALFSKQKTSPCREGETASRWSSAVTAQSVLSPEEVSLTVTPCRKGVCLGGLDYYVVSLRSPNYILALQCQELAALKEAKECY